MQKETLLIKCQQWGDAVNLNINPLIVIPSEKLKSEHESLYQFKSEVQRNYSLK